MLLLCRLADLLEAILLPIVGRGLRAAFFVKVIIGRAPWSGDCLACLRNLPAAGAAATRRTARNLILPIRRPTRSGRGRDFNDDAFGAGRHHATA